MAVTPAQNSPPVEPRWPVMIAVVIALVLVATLPRHIRVVPVWVHIVMTGLLLLPMTMVGLYPSEQQRRWLRIEHVSTAIFTVLVMAAEVLALIQVLRVLLSGSALASGFELLAASVTLWAGNVLAFSLCYWLVDRGGPEARAGHFTVKPDWVFPPETAPGSDGSEWRPVYIDYLFLAFTTATAFSPTDTLPLTARAKLLMMLQTVISLATILVVASRAVNVLGG